MRHLPSERRELTVTLELQGDRLERSYSWGAYGHSHANSTLWKTEAGFADAVNAVLDRGDESELETSFAGIRQSEVGGQLFGVLFGERSDWQPVLRGLFDWVTGPSPNPTRGAVRLRIATTEKSLIGLPWRLTSWEGFPLSAGHDWTFEVALPGESRSDVHVAAPLKILVLAPRYSHDELHTEEHLADLQAFLGRLSPDYLEDKRECYRRVVDRPKLRLAVDRIRPDLVYYYGHGTVDADQLCLRLSDDSGDLLSAAELASDVAKAAPQAAYLNGCLTGASGQQSAGHLLSASVPLVIVNRTTAWSRFAQETAIEWLKAWLMEGNDPIVAIHRIAASASLRDFEWFGPSTHASYAGWKTDRHGSGRAPIMGSLALDRKLQRAPTLERVLDVIESDTQRVAVIFAYAAPGNLLNRHCEQLLSHIVERAHHVASPLRLKLEVPRKGDRQGFEQRLEDSLRLQLRAKPTESLESLFRRIAPHNDSSRRTPLLWLDWDCLEGGDLLTETELESWFSFSGKSLPEACPHSVRLVSYLAMEVAPGKISKLEKDLPGFRRNAISPYCGFVDCPPLDIVNFDDLYQHLTKRDLTTCPPKIAKDVAEAIERETGGHYENTVSILDQGEALGWERLLRRLRGEPTQVPAIDSDDGYG